MGNTYGRVKHNRHYLYVKSGRPNNGENDVATGNCLSAGPTNSNTNHYKDSRFSWKQNCHFSTVTVQQLIIKEDKGTKKYICTKPRNDTSDQENHNT